MSLNIEPLRRESLTRADRVFAQMDAIFAEVMKTCAEKNSDYADPHRDPWKNLRLCELMGIASLETGIMVRLTDKLQRMANLLERPPTVTDESIEDTGKDAIAYLGLLLAWRRIGRRDTPGVS